MAPTTRNRRQQKKDDTVAAAPPAATNGVKKPNGHIKFDSDDEDDGVVGGGVALDGVEKVNGDADESEKKEESEEEESDDDDAPEAVTIGSGREAAKKKEEDARRAIEAQEEAAKQKRKRREAILKEQKASAAKRRKVETSEPDVETAAEEEDAAPAEESEKQIATISKPKAPALLPESLLEKIADRPSPPPRVHKRAGDFESEDEGSDGEMMGFDFDDEVDEGAALKRKAKNRKRALARKAKMEFKKGPVNVKVLKDDKKMQKLLMPPANKKVANVKNAWLRGRGTVKRRAVEGGIGSAFPKK